MPSRIVARLYILEPINPALWIAGGKTF